MNQVKKTVSFKNLKPIFKYCPQTRKMNPTFSIILLQTESAPDWVLFLGRFHPLIVHLPIGILIVAALIEFFARQPRFSALRQANRFILFWGAVSASFACAAGYMLSLSGGYEQDALDTHALLGYAVAGTAWLAYLLKCSRGMVRKAFIPVFGISLLLVSAAGHFGGNLTHGSDYLTQYMPQPLRKVAGLPPRQDTDLAAKKITDINQALVYQDLVRPALNQSCVACHNAEKQKGKLRMDTPELLTKGGKNGAIFVAGNAEQSEMIKRLHLPLEDEHHMPPKGKTQLTENQIAMLTWWIGQGAPFDRKVAELNVTDGVKPILASFADGGGGAGKGGETSESGKLSPALLAKVPVADAKALDALRKINVLIIPVAQANNLLEISFVNAKNFNDSQAKLLASVAEQTVWLKLSHTQAGDQTLSELAKFKHLNRLHLEFTDITDAGLKHLKNLPYLESLNLYGTQITDAGLKELASLKSLKTLYLWQTNVTPQGAAELQKALPDTEINTGMTEEEETATVKKLVSDRK